MITAGHKIQMDGKTLNVEHVSKHPSATMLRVTDGETASFLSLAAMEKAGGIELPCLNPDCFEHGITAFNAASSKHFAKTNGWALTPEAA